MDKPSIELTDEELALLREIEFNSGSGPSEKGKRNTDAVVLLWRSLVTRGGVPEARMRWVADPTLNIGSYGSCSSQPVAGNTGCEEIVRQPQFLKHLRYFLFGPELPEEVISAFKERLGDPERVTSKNIVVLCNFARRLAREHKLGDAAAQEFYKLALECGLWQPYAAWIEKAVKHAR